MYCTSLQGKWKLLCPIVLKKFRILIENKTKFFIELDIDIKTNIDNKVYLYCLQIENRNHKLY